MVKAFQLVDPNNTCTSFIYIIDSWKPALIKSLPFQISVFEPNFALNKTFISWNLEISEVIVQQSSDFLTISMIRAIFCYFNDDL